MIRDSCPWNVIRASKLSLRRDHVIPPLNKPHNGHLAALIPEVTHAEFLRKELEFTVGFDREEIQMSLISLWEKFIAYR